MARSQSFMTTLIVLGMKFIYFKQCSIYPQITVDKFSLVNWPVSFSFVLYTFYFLGELLWILTIQCLSWPTSLCFVFSTTSCRSYLLQILDTAECEPTFFTALNCGLAYWMCFATLFIVSINSYFVGAIFPFN